MPVIVCPGCGKQYKVAATAAGQIAKCACGKRFRLGGAQDKSPAAKVATATANLAPTSTLNTSKPAPRTAAAAPDDFWDDALPIAEKPKPSPVLTSTGQPVSTTTKVGGNSVVQSHSKQKADSAPKKKRKKSKRIHWGFDWGKVVGGLGTFLIFGGVTAAMAMTSGRISLYLAGVAIVGLFTMLNGL